MSGGVLNKATGQSFDFSDFMLIYKVVQLPPGMCPPHKGESAAAHLGAQNLRALYNKLLNGERYGKSDDNLFDSQGHKTYNKLKTKALGRTWERRQRKICARYIINF